MAVIIPIVAKFIDEGVKEAITATKGIESNADKTAAALSKIAGPAKVATAAMVTGMVGVAKNAGSAKKANDKLAASFAAVGYPENAAAAMKYADTLQHVIGVSDEEIQATMQKLAAFKDVAKSQDTMARATLAAANMSAAGFGTMESAATALGRALTNPLKGMTSLERMGVQFTEQQHKQVEAMMEVGDKAGAQAIIMKQVEDTYDGVAKASASGTEKMKLQWDEAAESIGKSFAPALSLITALLFKLGAFMGEHTKAVTIFAIAFTTLTASIVVANAVMSAWGTITKTAAAAVKAYNLALKLGKTAQTVFAVATKLSTGTITQQAAASALAAKGLKLQATAMKIATVATKLMAVAMKALRGPIGWITAAVVALAILIIKNWDKIKAITQKVWNWIGGFLKGIWNGIKSAASKTWDAIVKVVQKAWDFIKRIIRLNPFIFVLTHLDKIKGWIAAAWDWIKAKTKAFWDFIKGMFRVNPFTAIKGFLDTLKGWFTSAFSWITGKIDAFMGKVNSMVDAVQGAFNKAKSIADKIPGLGKSGKAGAATAVPLYDLPVTRSLADGVPAATRLGAVREGGGSGGPTINVYGALDPEAVARQIRKLLDAHDARQGRAVAKAVAF